MIRIQLDATTRAQLQALRRTTLPATVRNRLEIVLLSDAGWSPPRIARHLGCHPHTSRAVLKAFRDKGQPSLWPDRPGPEPDQQRRQAVAEALRNLLAQERTWTSLHVSRVTKAARLGLAKLGISLYYLPAYSPELNEIPRRSHTSKAELPGSVEQGFDAYRKQLRPKGEELLCPAA